LAGKDGDGMAQKAPDYNDEVCSRDHVGEVPKELIESLPMTERHPYKHRCAACAYEAGMNEAQADMAGLMETIKNLNAQVASLTEEAAKLRGTT
jgi:hypothetical protein